MTVFLDTNVFVSALAGDERSAACSRLLTATIAGKLEARTSVGVAEELWHLELSGSAPVPVGAAAKMTSMLGPLLPLDEDVVLAAFALPAHRIGANDRIFAATCIAHGIDTIVTADRAFDELDRPRRLDPIEAAAELLG